jgi:O-methyltransferase
MTTPIEIAKTYSKASMQRTVAMYDALRRIDAEAIAGDVVECGVWRGGQIMLARMVTPQRRCWLYDTFEGMTAPGPHDRKRSGNKPPAHKALSKSWTMASLDEVIGNFKLLSLYDESKLTFIVGDVCQTLLVPDNLPERIALLRLDTDWYESTKVELEVLWPRLVKGGVIIIDDYGHWLGVRKAVDEFFAHELPGFQNRLRQIDYTAYMMVK